MSETEPRFSEDDLRPSDDEVRAARREAVDRGLAGLAVLVAGAFVGGLVALGFAAAPFVFRLTPKPFNGKAMGAAFERLDRVSLGIVVVLLLIEGARTWLGKGRSRAIAARIRRVGAVAMGAAVAFVAFRLTPQIRMLHEGGAVRGEGDDGRLLDAVHRLAETVSTVAIGLALLVAILHVWTIHTGTIAAGEEDDEDAPAPMPPGPREGNR